MLASEPALAGNLGGCMFVTPAKADGDGSGKRAQGCLDGHGHERQNGGELPPHRRSLSAKWAPVWNMAGAELEEPQAIGLHSLHGSMRAFVIFAFWTRSSALWASFRENRSSFSRLQGAACRGLERI